MRTPAILATLIAAAIPTLHATDPFPKEDQILRDVKVAPGFDFSLFSAPPQSNYPTFITTTPDGVVYVGSDGNSAQQKNPDRGRILRLRDTDGDGRADEVKEFVKVDSPRGLVVDGNTVYCVHPPHVSAYIDKDGDGVSDEEKVIVKNLGWSFKDRSADHATNGIELGIDGWLYIAAGDFGFMEAEGTDGRKLRLRGGGVVRVRPDGTKLELFARGTRNILEAVVTPLLDVFSRDNNNDGGGWEIRLHHHTAFLDHGYPRLYKNFPGEFVEPIFEYRGGSGMGGGYIEEPNWPAEWNDKPYTGDWGRGAFYRQDMTPKGATFAEGKPVELIKMRNTSDMDIDARGYLYAGTLRGAVYTYNGPDVGAIIRMWPKGMTPAKVPDFNKLQDAELVKLLETPSNRIRLEAQRTLLRRGPLKPPVMTALATMALNKNLALNSRVAALFTVRQGAGPEANDWFGKMIADPTIAPWAVRAFGDYGDPRNTFSHAPAFAALKSEDARVRREAVIAIARFSGLTGIFSDNDPLEYPLKNDKDVIQNATALVPLLGDSDPIVVHTTYQVLRGLQVSAPIFAALDDPKSSPALREGASLALRGIHDKATVDGLIARLTSADAAVRQVAITALSRLFYLDAQWKGQGWGTRPDFTGPYYQPEEWAESKRIAAALQGVMSSPNGEDVALAAKEASRNRLKLTGGGAALVSLALKDPKMVPSVVKQLSESDTISGEGVAVLIKAASDTTSSSETLAQCVTALVKTDGENSLRASLAALDRLTTRPEQLNRVREVFLNSRLVENQHLLLENIAEKFDGNKSVWADAALLRLAGKKVGAPEPRELSAKALDAGWTLPQRKMQIIRAAMVSNDRNRARDIALATTDSNPEVAKLANDAVRQLRIDVRAVTAAPAASPTIGSLKVEDVLAQVMTIPGDPRRGEQLFTQYGCVACHTVKSTEPLKGPFLGTIATNYRRGELAESILLPNKSVSQGFVTNLFTMKDGAVHMGFITQEAADRIVIRTIAAQEVVLDPNNVSKREKKEESLMPEKLMNGATVADLASMVAYLEDLAKK